MTDQTDPDKLIPKFDVKTWLMSLDGSVDVMPTYWQPDSSTFNLAQNNVVIIGNGTLPSSFTSIGSLSSPSSTTATTSLKYKLLNSDGSEITTTNDIFASVKSYVDGTGNNTVWYLQTASSFSNLSESNSWSYRIQVVGSKAYINLKMSVVVSVSSVTSIAFTFTSGDYL